MARLIALVFVALLLGGCATFGLPARGTVERAEQLLEQGRAAEAVAEARQVPRGSPGYARAQTVAARAAALQSRVPREALARGEVLEASGRLLEAIRVYESALLADPRHAGLQTRLAAVREALARERERRRFAAERVESEALLAAHRAWTAVAEVEPSDQDVRRRLAELASNRLTLATVHLARAQSLHENGRFREALQEADLAARLDSQRAEARALVARLQAEMAVAEAAEARPRGEPAFVAPAVAPASSADVPKADVAVVPAKGEAGGAEAKARPKEAAKPDAKGDPHKDPRVDKKPVPKGTDAKPAEAAGAKGGDSLAPSSSGTLSGSQAEAVVREAVAVAQSAARRGDYRRALRVLATAEAQVPGNPDLALERTAIQRLVDAEVEERINRGISRFQLEDLEGAIEEWRRALELDPDNAVALDYRKKAEGMLKKIEELREEARRRGDTPAGGP